MKLGSRMEIKSRGFFHCKACLTMMFVRSLTAGLLRSMVVFGVLFVCVKTATCMEKMVSAMKPAIAVAVLGYTATG